MDIARTREAKLEQQGASVRTRDTNIVAIRQNPSPQCEKCGLTHGKNAQPKALGVGSVTSGIIGSKVKNKQTQDWRTKPSPRKQPETEKPQDKTSQSKVHVVEDTSSDFDELCFEAIHIDSSSVNLGRNEAFAKIKVELPNVDHPSPVLKVKVDTGAQRNILPLRIYKSMFPDHVDENGLSTGTTPS